MAVTSASGRRSGEVRPEWKSTLDGVGVVPPVGDLRSGVDTAGAVIVPGYATDPERLVDAAATALGGRLRELFGIRPQGGADAPVLGLHSDGANVVVDVHGRSVRLRDPDEDWLFMLCGRAADSGGDSVLVDGYALVEALRTAEDPELREVHEFLVGTDVDYFGAWVAPARGVPGTPLVRRLVEYTRTGRRVVRASDYAAPVPREPEWERHAALLDRYADVLATAMEVAPRFRLDAGDLFVLDNYRFLHGRDGYRGERTLHVLTVRSIDAA
ncbi:TauD/TfdA family dioxygenase [Pseudonocardia pini]|uniref:TauD/TfdA family dioxygenase n=1 Tax=Pseudonocardia pini TaxID=2758030 RepID=UPI0015F0B1CE|nr:TauD/TfdA family dioxygenase [Pseudonocardia pini]